MVASAKHPVVHFCDAVWQVQIPEESPTLDVDRGTVKRWQRRKVGCLARLTEEKGLLSSLAGRMHDETQFALVATTDKTRRGTLAASWTFLIASFLSASTSAASFASARNTYHDTFCYYVTVTVELSRISIEMAQFDQLSINSIANARSSILGVNGARGEFGLFFFPLFFLLPTA